jgi:uncharacterized protein YoaH (UPF0181 family)|tara:strand:+ start:69 stop:530 length:462 start_codon:yes stop_codon:yes gene_type:complete
MPTGKTHRKNTFTEREQKKAVNYTFSLVKEGSSITRARKMVADELDISPNTLWVWQDKFGMKVPNVIKTTDLVKNHGTTSSLTKSSTGAIKGLENMKGQLGVVFSSLVNQDGRFSNQDATAISGTANVILGCCKQVLLERKAINKVTKTEHLS